MGYTSLAMTTVVVMVGSTEASRMVKKQPPAMHPVVAGFAVGLFLFALGMASESLAAKFCVLIIVASLILNGMPLFQALSK